MLPRPPTSTLFPYTTLFRSLQGIAAQVAELTDVITPDLGQALSSLRVDGGLTRSRLLMQAVADLRSEEHTSELQSQFHLVCRLLLEKKKESCSCTSAKTSRS